MQRLCGPIPCITRDFFLLKIFPVENKHEKTLLPKLSTFRVDFGPFLSQFFNFFDVALLNMSVQMAADIV
jgi:hypothetical protein